MARFAASSAFHEDWPVAMDLALSALDMPEDANLGFVYFADQYGGDLAARSRFAIELIQAVRAAVGTGPWSF